MNTADFGNRLATLRQKHGLTQAALAEKLGLQQVVYRERKRVEAEW